MPLPPLDRASVPIDELLTVASEYEGTGRLEDAERLVRHVLAADPQHAEALHLGGIVAYRRRRYDEALARMQGAIRHGVNTQLYLRNICEVYRTLGRVDEALAAGLRAQALAPGDPLCLLNLAVVHYHRLELDASVEAAQQALAIDPGLAGAHFALAEALLLRGEMARGWDEYEWRFRIQGAAPPMPPTGKPQWQGQALEGRTLLLVADQGFGDAIQFMRYIPWAASRCAEIAIASSPELMPLLHQIAPRARLFSRWDDAPDHAAHCTLSGLPRLHGTRLATIPWHGPYLHSRPERRLAWAERLAGLLPSGYARVGIVWSGRATHTNDRSRSIGLPALRPLGDLPRVALLALQKGAAAAAAGDWFGRAPLVGLGAEIADYDDTMAILDNLDLLLTVDTSVGHLAGAMGRPVWLMLPHAPDWRWLLDRDETPWYPRHRLWRQNADRSWPDQVTRVAHQLPAFLAVHDRG